jgi:TonB family protein
LTSIAFPIVQPRLEYPEALAGSGITRRLRLRLFVDERGVVRKLEFVEPRREEPFESAARKAWNEVRFSPAMKDGVAVKSQKLLELDFIPN